MSTFVDMLKRSIGPLPFRGGLREGTFIRRFTAKDGRQATLRAPRWSDLDDMLDFINSLVEEDAEISVNETITRDGEIDYISKLLSDLERDMRIAVVAEVEGRFVGSVEVRRERNRSRHVGVLGIAIRSECRDLGIGAELMKEAEAQARKMGLKMLMLEVFATNSRARYLYDKVGYRSVGCVPNMFLRAGTYVDEIIMVKDL